MWLMTQSEVDRIDAIFERSAGLADMGVSSSAAPMKMGRGAVATIEISGPILAQRSPILDFFGELHTSYADIREQSGEAVTKGAKRIDFRVNSPGGTVNGLYETMGIIKDLPVKTRSIVGHVATSAAYMLASQADKIIADNDASLIGSVGVVMTVRRSDDEINVTNTDSPDKYPDASTEGGQGVIRAGLDDLYQVIAEKIALGRNVSPETVKKEYGQGAVMTARTALQRKMIDAIGVETIKPAGELPAAVTQGVKQMDIETLKAEHGDLYRQVVKVGAKKERDRVQAHLVLADASGDIKAAHEAIVAGDGVTQAVQAKHIAAGIKKRSIALREEENPENLDASAAPPKIDPLERMIEEVQAEDSDLILEV